MDWENATTAGTAQFCTFYVEGLMFGVEVTQVQEVLLFQETTRVPLAPETVQGLMNLRGQIVTAIDLRRRLKFAPLPDGREPMNVVLRTGDGAVSLLVDEIGDVVEPEESLFEAPPSTVQGIARQLVRGVFKMPDRLLMALDVERTLNLEPDSTAALG